MKHLLLFTLLITLALPMAAQNNDKKPRIDKQNCTYVNKDGKTFPLHGKVQIVNSFPDIKVKIVDAFEDIDVKIVDAFPNECGKIQIVNSFPDVKVQIVDAFPDITVKIVDAFPGIKK